MIKKSVKFKATEDILVLNIFREIDYSQKVQELIEKNKEIQTDILKELGINSND